MVTLKIPGQLGQYNLEPLTENWSELEVIKFDRKATAYLICVVAIVTFF